jgi:hypothetical protein
VSSIPYAALDATGLFSPTQGADELLDTPYRTHVVWCRRLEV